MIQVYSDAILTLKSVRITLPSDSFMLTDSAESLLVMLEKHDDCGYKKPVLDCQQDTEYKPQTPVSE